MDWKTASVFISSTFNDMHAERDYLIKYVFPELAEWCEKRRIRLVDIDLRWGVTSEESQNNHALRKCLENIDKCRPFFLCLIGQRRGWVPNDPQRISYFDNSEDEISLETKKEYPDVLDRQKDSEHNRLRSVTEMEIEHALLAPLRWFGEETPPFPCQAVFFERINPFGSLTEDVFTKWHKRVYTNEDVMDWGGSRKDADVALNDLKDRIGRSRIAPYFCEWDHTDKTPELSEEKVKTKENDKIIYNEVGSTLKNGRLVKFKSSVQFVIDCVESQFNINDSLIKEFRAKSDEYDNIEFKDAVIFALQCAILSDAEFSDRLNPCASNEDAYEIDKEQQELFVNSIADDLIGRDDVIDKLNHYLKNESTQIFLLTAKAGYGKTTLLTNFIKRLKDLKVLYRFCGVSDLTADSYSLWDSLCHQAEVEMPIVLDDLSREITTLLEKYANQGVSVLVIDAIDQIQNGLEMLQWFNRPLPNGLKLIISIKENAKNADIIESCEEKKFFYREPLTPLSDENIQSSLIDKFLLHYLKALDERQKKELCAKNISGNPLFLKIVLHELRRFGSFTQLPKEIESYGAQPTQAFTKMLERLESDSAYDLINPKTAVPFLFGLLSCTRNGLTEDEIVRCFSHELIQNIGGENQRKRILGTVRFFYRQVRPFMARRNGRIDFLYDSFKEAALYRYKEDHKKLHEALSNCFLKKADPADDKSFNSDDIRALIELGYHTAQFDYQEGLRLYEDLPYLDVRCSKTPIQLLLSEISRFNSNVCNEFYKIILRNQAILSNYPNALFSICRAVKSSPMYLQTEELISAGRCFKPWIETKQIYSFHDDVSDSEEELPSALSLKLIAKSNDYAFNEGCGFSPDGSVFFFSETLGRVRVFDNKTFELLPCLIQSRSIRIISLQISTDREYLAVAYEDAVVELFTLKYGQDGQLLQAVNIKTISAFKPRRGFSSYGFVGTRFCYQSDTQTVMAIDLVSATPSEVLRSEQPFILDAIVSLENGYSVLAVHQGMYSTIYYHSRENTELIKLKEFENVFVRRSYKSNDNYFGIVLSDNHVLVLDIEGNIVAKTKPDANVKEICNVQQKLLLLCHDDVLILWDWLENRSSVLYTEKNRDQHLNYLAYSDSNIIMSTLGASIAKFEKKTGNSKTIQANKQIISFNELPELTVAVRENNRITIHKKDFCSTPFDVDNRMNYEISITSEGVYLFNEFGQGHFLASKQRNFVPLKYEGQPIRILKNFAGTDGCVYYIDTLRNFCCGQSSFQYDLSQYHFEIINIRAFSNYIFMFGSASGVQATQNASTGYEKLSGTLLVFEIVRHGFLRFCTERLFSSKHGNLADLTFSQKTNRLYIVFNTPHSAKKSDLLHVCYGTVEELISGNEYYKELNIARTQGGINPSTACAANSYLVCYQGNLYAYDAETLQFESAIAIDSSFNRLQSSQTSSAHAFALCGNGTEIKTITPLKSEVKKC